MWGWQDVGGQKSVMFEDEGNMCKCSNEVGAAIYVFISSAV